MEDGDILGRVTSTEVMMRAISECKGAESSGLPNKDLMTRNAVNEGAFREIRRHITINRCEQDLLVLCGCTYNLTGDLENLVTLIISRSFPSIFALAGGGLRIFRITRGREDFSYRWEDRFSKPVRQDW